MMAHQMDDHLLKILITKIEQLPEHFKIELPRVILFYRASNSPWKIAVTQIA